MIGVDWGTSNFRAFRLRDGEVIARIEAGPGLLTTQAGGFEAALREAIGPWLRDGETRVLLCGMVGSRQGWAEAAYLPCPADPAALAAHTHPVPFQGASVRIVPGLRDTDGAGVPEVMRGEEVQLAGVIGQLPDRAHVCLPGSHSKWARIEQGCVAGFTTYLTGEAFAALRGHTILGRAMTDGPAAPEPGGGAPFARGVARSAEPGGLLHHLFGVRTLGLFDRLAGDEAAAFLSGLLIGHEVRAAAPDGMVHLVGAPALCALYAAAIAQAGGQAKIEDHDAAARGLARIGEHVAWD